VLTDNSPWLHWISPRNSDIIQCCSPDVKQQLLNTAWISSNGNPFGKVETADQLQLFIQSGVDQWTSQRKQHDFSGSPSQVKIQRWMAHLLLTTTVNIQAGQFTSIAGKDAVGIPIDFFINSNSQISGNLTKVGCLTGHAVYFDSCHRDWHNPQLSRMIMTALCLRWVYH